MTKRVVGDRGMRQIHHHRPECATDYGTLLRQLGYRSNGLCQLFCIHHTTRRIVLLYQFLVTVVTLMQPHLELLLAQVVVGHEGRLCHHHLIIHILHRHTSARSISHRQMISRTRVGIHIRGFQQRQGLVDVGRILQQVLYGSRRGQVRLASVSEPYTGS